MMFQGVQIVISDNVIQNLPEWLKVNGEMRYDFFTLQADKVAELFFGDTLIITINGKWADCDDNRNKRSKILDPG